jgi:hypothetical protein
VLGIDLVVITGLMQQLRADDNAATTSPPRFGNGKRLRCLGVWTPPKCSE